VCVNVCIYVYFNTEFNYLNRGLCGWCKHFFFQFNLQFFFVLHFCFVKFFSFFNSPFFICANAIGIRLSVNQEHFTLFFLIDLRFMFRETIERSAFKSQCFEKKKNLGFSSLCFDHIAICG